MYTLNLFKSTFELAPTHANKGFAHSAWESDETVNALHRDAAGKPLFLLHDGPPYANGNLHLGHFVNKTLKDALLKFKRLDGYFAPFVPGFDCHGLPVELEVEKLGHSKSDPQAFVRACREYALGQVALQSEEFKAFGVSADWEQRYLTLAPEFEAGAAKYFQALPQVVQRLRPVHWCSQCASSLAEAEVEYKPKKSDSVVVLFEMAPAGPGTPDAAPKRYLQVWTTTPYTLPANKAVAFNQGLNYVEVTEEVEALGGRVTLVRVRKDTDPAELPAVLLAGTHVVSPYTGAVVPVLPADYVSNSGPGLVHLAPSFGMDDFRVGEAFGLAVETFVDATGKFVLGDMQGMNFSQATAHVLEKLGPLVHSHEKVDHEYPHCWRHKSPLFFKASTEWFLDLTLLGDKALEALADVDFVPASGRERLASMLRTRTSWCVSRTRLWGSPLADPANSHEQALLEAVAVQGVEAWHEGQARRTLDVWFDSGVTHELVMRKRFGRTADVYLEGTDQHRGWFQSSLLTSVAAGNPAPYKTLVTHGFVVDEQGKKYSKSSKNYQTLDKLFAQYSPDVLRLWALSQDYTRDLKLSKESLARTVEKFRKMRNTLRFCLQNTADFDFGTTVPLTSTLNLYQVAAMHELVALTSAAAASFNFSEAVLAVYQFCESASNDYFTALKDMLYCDVSASPRRVEAQYVLSLMLQVLMRVLAPVLPYTTEELFQGEKERMGLAEGSALLLTFASLRLPSVAAEALVSYAGFKELKHAVHQFVEANRESGLKSPAQLDLTVTTPTELPTEDLQAFFGCARLTLLPGTTYSVEMARTRYLLCPRCRSHQATMLTSLCKRCEVAEAT